MAGPRTRRTIRREDLTYKNWEDAVWEECKLRLGGVVDHAQFKHISASGFETAYDLGTPISEVADQLMEEMPH